MKRLKYKNGISRDYTRTDGRRRIWRRAWEAADSDSSIIDTTLVCIPSRALKAGKGKTVACKSNSILTQLFKHLAQLSVLADQLYFISIEISGNLDFQGERRGGGCFATVGFCKFLVL